MRSSLAAFAAVVVFVVIIALSLPALVSAVTYRDRSSIGSAANSGDDMERLFDMEEDSDESHVENKLHHRLRFSRRSLSNSNPGNTDAEHVESLVEAAFDPSRLHPTARTAQKCPEEGAPSVGDTLWIHVPSHDHLVPRFHGMRVFAPTAADKYERERGHIKKHPHDVFNEHHEAKILYVFDDHAVRALWPARAYEHGGKNFKILLTDLFVVTDHPHRAHDEQDKSKPPLDMCFFRATFVL